MGRRRAAFEQLQGKELSYNNIVDLEAAWAMPQEFAEPTVAIIKHTNPSGLASAPTLWRRIGWRSRAIRCRPTARSSRRTARWIEHLVEEIGSLFVEVLAAPGYTPDALAWLAEHKKNCRVMLAPCDGSGRLSVALGGGRPAGADI